ncbi:MAG: [Fe-Fe] hydrogenase large subunit C-terminal domain-containing protein [Candidatus Nanoarchaeia archaeon]|nr:[Fe-Fe] hydrogenase large subunit C-terminal domain-containing protein [Candidatus Nanoarchaeia archaeon]
MEYNDDQKNVLKILKSKDKKFLMAAPSFPIDFNYSTFVALMKKLGFDNVSELTFGAKIVNHEYREYINAHKDQEMFITSPCPSIVNLVKNKFPEYVKYLMPFDSPMIAMAKIIKHNYPKYKIVFLSPCFAKKLEAKNSGIIDATVTFKEMKEIIENEKIKAPKKKDYFDKFYNEYTKIYPIDGGLAKTMNAKNIFKKSEMVSCSDCIKLEEIFEKNKGKKFFDLLFCKGGCIGGPGILSKESTNLKKKKILDYKEYSEQEVMGKKRGLNKHLEGIDFSAKF